MSWVCKTQVGKAKLRLESVGKNTANMLILNVKKNLRKDTGLMRVVQ